MLPFRTLRICQIVLLTLIVTYVNATAKNEVQNEKIPIGVVFDQNTEDIQNAFKYAVLQHTNQNKTRLEFQLFVDVINTADAFKLSRLICNQFTRGVIAMMGAVSPDSFDILHSFTNTFQMPFVTPWFPEKVIPPSSGLVDYAISLRPDYHRAVIDTITYYGWKNVIYLYDSHDGLLRLQQLYQSLRPGVATFRLSNVKRVSNASDVVAFLGAIERLDRWSTKHVVLDSTTQLAKETLILHVRDVRLGRRNFHYFLSGLVMDDRWEKEVTEYGAINVTGFRVLDPSRKVVRDFITSIWKKDSLSAQAALMYDTALVLVDSVIRVIRKMRGPRKHPILNSTRFIDCNATTVIPYEHGDKISKMVKKAEIDGLTGPIRFDDLGHRENFTLQIMEMNEHGEMIKIASWRQDIGLVPVVPKQQPLLVPGEYNRNKTYIISTIEEPPYIMRVDLESPQPKPKGPFKGFCVDLAKILAEKLEIKYEMRLVRDGKYGMENTKQAGGWDGLIGELLRKEVDIVIAPLLVTVEREAVVDFSKPFLSFDIKPHKKSGNGTGAMFSFLHPLSKEIWICLLFSMFAVSAVLYFVSKFSPHEWRVVSSIDTQSSDEVAATKTAVVNELSFWNSMWFSVSSFMQQGSDITPRSISGRIVGTVWWFFTLIVISSYTANLASHLIMKHVSEPLSYNKVTTCPEDTTNGRTSEENFNDENWLGFLIDRPFSGSNRPCEMLVTITHSGVKDFAIALPKGSQLRNGVNLALQALKNEGELQTLIRKWFVKTDSDENDKDVTSSELTLNRVAGLFYVLLGGLVLGLFVALLEFCQHRRTEAAQANVPLRTALSAKARLASRKNRTHQPRTPNRDRDQVPWNGGAAFAGYMPANQMYQEETALHASFSQV